MDGGILVVSAPDGPMPQTKEHILLARQVCTFSHRLKASLSLKLKLLKRKDSVINSLASKLLIEAY